MDELTKVRVNNLISLRQSLLVLLPILIGGTIGMLFINGYNIARTVLFIIGSFYIIVMIKSLINTVTEINQCIYGKENKKWNKQYKE